MKKKPTLLLLLICFALSCKKETVDTSNMYKNIEGTSPLDILKNGIIIGGDMLIPAKNGTSNRSVVFNTSNTGYTPVQPQYQRGISVKLKSYGTIYGNTTAYSDALDKAINNWNILIPRSNISFTRVGVDSAADVEVSLFNFGYTGWGAVTMLPEDGKPSQHVYLNDYWLSNWPGAGTLATLLTHEFGHVVGFGHCDDTDTTTISYMFWDSVPVSPSVTGKVHTVPWSSSATNPNSIMNAGEGYGNWTQEWTNYQNTSFPCNYAISLPTAYSNVGQYNKDGTYQNKGFTTADINDIEYIYPYLPKTIPSTRSSTSNKNYYKVDYIPPGAIVACWKLYKVVAGEAVEFTAQEHAAGWVPYLSETFDAQTEVGFTFPINTSGQSYTVRIMPLILKGNIFLTGMWYPGHPPYFDAYVL